MKPFTDPSRHRWTAAAAAHGRPRRHRACALSRCSAACEIGGGRQRRRSSSAPPSRSASSAHAPVRPPASASPTTTCSAWRARRSPSGLTIGGKKYDVEIIDKDSQSNPQRAAQVANDLINSDERRPDADHLDARRRSTRSPTRARPPASRASRPSCRGRRGTSAAAPSPRTERRSSTRTTSASASRSSTRRTPHLWPQVPTNKKVGVMWPNDSDGNAIRAALGPAAREGRLHDRRPGRLRERHQRLLGADREVQGGELRDLQHLPDPAGLRHLLAAGRAAGLQAEDRPDRQDRAVPVAGRGARRRSASASPARAYWTPDVPVHVLADQVTAQGARPRATRTTTGKQWNQQLGPSLALFDVGRRGAAGRRRPEGQGRGGQGDRHASRSRPRSASLHWGKGPNGTSSRHRSSAASGSATAGGKYPLDLVMCENSSDPNVPVAGAAEAVRRHELAPTQHREPARSPPAPMLAGRGLSKTLRRLLVLDGVDFARRRRRGGRHRRPERRRQDDAAGRPRRVASARRPGTVALRRPGRDPAAAASCGAGGASAARSRCRGRSAG